MAAAFLSGFLSAAIGIAGGVLPAAVLAVALPVRQAVPLLAPIVLAGEIAAAPIYRKAWSGRHFLVLLPPLVAGTWLGTEFLTGAPPRLIARAMAAFVILAALPEILRRPNRVQARPGSPKRWLGHPLGGILAGLCAGITSAVAHAGGILITPYLLAAGLAKEAFVGTALAILALGDTAKLVSFQHAGLLTPSMTRPILYALPLLFVGVGAGWQVHRRLTIDAFRRIVAYALLVVGILLLAR
jgi:uncharacterized membrane protein YfcA